MDKPLLSICIPTKNRCTYLQETLRNLTSEDLFLHTNKIEIVISDNCSDDDTQKICENFVAKFPDKIRYFRQEFDIKDKNFIEVLKLANGVYAKLNNDNLTYKNDGIKKIIDTLENINEAVVFISNRKTSGNIVKLKKYTSFDKFLCDVTYSVTWIASLCLRRDAFLSLDNPDRFSHLNFAQVDIIARLINAYSSVIVFDSEILDSNVINKKGGYNICKVFGENFISILNELVNEGYVSSSVYNKTIRKLLLEHISKFHFDDSNNFTFEKGGYFKYLFKYYKLKPYYYFNYFRSFKKYIFRIEKDSLKKKFIIFNLIKVTIKRKKVNVGEQAVLDDYSKYIVNSSLDLKSQKSFIPLCQDDYVRKDNDSKLIAFYLPQYHTIPLNDECHGKGFTDWKNVTTSIPQFVGHYQPHLPADCGFYDLTNPKVLEEQSKIAQKYGIYGFCYHYYWFSGQRLLEKPLFDMLNNPNVTIPFCLCWANENWSKLWDGGNKEVIMSQQLNDDDDEKFFYDILPFFKDSRYIKFENKPLLVIYRPALFTNSRFNKFISTIRKLAKENGFDDLYIISSNYKSDYNPLAWGVDAMLEFPPHGLVENGIKLKPIDGIMNPKFKGTVFDIEDYILTQKHLKYNLEYPLYKGVFPSWDNSARKAYSNATVFYGMTTDLYKKWLKDSIKYTKENNAHNIVFINAWNEWAEGAHLEADLKNGYAYLQATKEVLEECNV